MSPRHRLLFSHASAEVRGENTPERNVASTGDQTPNHQVMSYRSGEEKKNDCNFNSAFLCLFNPLPDDKMLD